MTEVTVPFQDHVLLSCARSLLESLKHPRRAEEKHEREVAGMAFMARYLIIGP